MTRVDKLYKNLLDGAQKKKELWPNEYMTILDSPEIEQEPLIVRKAIAFKKFLSEMPIKIHPNELIVGQTAQGTIGMGLAFIDYATEEEKQRAAEKGLGIKSIWGHITPMYEKVLDFGINGMRDKVQSRMNSLNPLEEGYQRKNNFLRAVLICYDGVEILIRRYVALAADQVQDASDENRRAELLSISGICSRIATETPQTFKEAIQLLWFTHMILHSTMEYVPLGRFDVYLYPFYKRDLEKGNITPGEAQDLIDCFWLRTNDRAQLETGIVDDNFDPAFMQLGGSFDIELEPQVLTMAWQQNVILAGKHADGSDATNDLTYMALESTRKLSLVNPVVTVRLSRNSTERLIRKCAECLQEGGGYPFIHNDDVIIEALTKLGIPEEEANVYGNDGCWEVTIPGKTEFRYSNIEALLCLELALNRGMRRITGKVDGPDTGDPTHFSNFEEVLAAFSMQMRHKIKGFVENIMMYYGSTYDIAPDPFLSSLLDDCIADAKDLTEGGARYILHSPLIAGLADTANSLAAIKKVVFEDKTLTMAKLINLLDTNFKGREDMRQMLINRVPKYGNNDDYVDEIALRILDIYTNLVNDREKEQNWIMFPCGAGTFERYILLGKHVGATPDGRKSQDWIAANLCPTVGSDKDGLSSLIRSFTKYDFTKLPAGSPLNIRVSRKFVNGEKGRENIVSLLRAFIELRGNLLTIIVHDAEILRKAQKEPEKYRSLKVTIGGYQVYFTLLTPEHQEYHIMRTEHGLA